MGCPGCAASLFGASSQYIKTNAGDIIAVDGANIREKLILSDLRMPYKQILKSRVILKPGQVNYLMNFLGLGNSANFLAIKAVYDPKSVLETDNYILWNYFDDFISINPMQNLLVLTGNSTNRIKQIYLTNPNINYAVNLDIMVGVIDDNYNFFDDVSNQSGLSLNGLRYTDIQTHIVDESLVIYSSDPVPVPICFIMICDISTITVNGSILVIDDTSIGSVYLDFIDIYNAEQAFSILELVRTTKGIIIQDLNPPYDNVAPVITFTNLVTLPGTTYSMPYTSDMGITFSATMSFSIYSTASSITKDMLVNDIIASVVDNRDVYMSFDYSSILLFDYTNTEITTIVQTGTYSVYFDILDNAGNIVGNDKNIKLYIV